VEQKRPDLLLEIVSLMPDVKFMIYGTPVLVGDHVVSETLKNFPNVELKGEYDGFSALPISEIGAFLYTSAWDGLPNTLLEAGSRCLPIVAPLVGGIGELINEATGWPVAPDAGADVYAERLRTSIAAADESRERARRLRDFIRARHADGLFDDTLRNVGYL
jgi:glycosyltransferase involved in cell wall biosynthesis